MNKDMIGYSEALKWTLENIKRLNAIELPLIDCADHICAKDIYSLADSPSNNSSLRDGFAVRSEDIEHATRESPVTLEVTDTAAAGLPTHRCVEKGSAIRVLTGALIPGGADAVVSQEFTERQDNRLTVSRHAESGRNILRKGIDLGKGEAVAGKGDILTPGRIGLIAASGHDRVWVIPKPRVAIIATGDEIVWPGKSLPEGKLYASNLMMLNAWCKRFHMASRLEIVPDDLTRITAALKRAAAENDAILTSGGAWMGDRDLLANALRKLGWHKIYHRVRMGPGKAAGFGILNHKPVFILPGGPPANLVAFLFLALPALSNLTGNNHFQLPNIPAKVQETVRGKNDWTQFIFGQIDFDMDQPWFRRIKWPSRLKSIASSHCIATIPERVEQILEGDNITATLLDDTR